ncbi:MAG: FtsX-like permease family protein [Candidatus Latescibacterota bacterium]|nr:FtsX-like permease family protein [Candidatus Latescibacterota bacterium]
MSNALLSRLVLVAMLALVVPVSSVSQPPFSSDIEHRLAASVEFLASLGSRVSGYPGNRRASDWVESELQELDFGPVRREAFELTVPKTSEEGSWLTVLESSERLRIHPLWPNGVRTTTLPPGGIVAPLIWAAGGEWEDYDGQLLDGRVILLDFNSWDHWLRAAALGARAIVFIEPEQTTYRQTLDKFVQAPLDVPRFWLDAEGARRLKRRLADEVESEIRLESRVTWTRAPAWNLWLKIDGIDPQLKQETIVVEAYYDGTSVVPDLAPAAEMSSSILALLELGRHLREHPPSRTVILLAAGAHYNGRAGIEDWVTRHARKHKFYADRMEEPLEPHLFIGLDLSSKTDQIAIWNNTNSFDKKRFFVPFGRRFTRYSEELSPTLGREGEHPLVNGISPIRGMDWSTFVPDGVSVDGQVAMMAGQVALSFVTVNDARFPVNTPLDLPEHVNISNLTRQVVFLNQLLSRSFNDPELFSDLEDFDPILQDEMRTYRARVRIFPRRSQIPDRPVPNAIVVVGEDSHKGVFFSSYHLTDENGETELPGMYVGGVPVTAYVVDDETGEITHAPDLSERSQRNGNGSPLDSGRLNWAVRWDQDTKTIVVFPCVSRPLYGLTSPNSLRHLRDVKIIDRGGVAPRQFGRQFGGYDTDMLMVFVPRERAKELRVMLNTEMFLINSPGGTNEFEAKGIGYDLANERLIPTPLYALQDMWRLNDARLATMREHAIENQRVNRLHELGRVLMEKAKTAYAEYRWSDYTEHLRAGLGVTTRAYPEVVGTLNDVIRGIVFFLALVLPAAFFGERLLFASPDIRWQLTGFAGLITVIWLVIAQVHPAFSIAHPMVILLAFAIMAMAIFVLSMVITRFNRFIREYRAEQAKVHETDISRVSAAYTAFMLGISNMRRRPLRTSLTLLTLTILTFTVLSFTSFKPDVRFLVFSQPHEGSYEGVLIRDRGWNFLNPSLYDYAQSHFGPHGMVSPRSWNIAYDDEEKKYTEVIRGKRSARSTALLGLTPHERKITGVDGALVAGRYFQEPREKSCLLSEKMAHALDLSAESLGEAEVQIFGEHYAVVGIFSATSLEEIRDLDDEILTPADFQLSSAQVLGPSNVSQMTVLEEAPELEVRPFVHLDPEYVVILPFQTLRVAFGGLRSVSVRFNEGAPAQELLEDFLVRINTTLFASIKDPQTGRNHVASYTSLGVTSVQGLGVLLIPMLIAALIVLNTMMGAVYERFREIEIYSSVGLAPTHIALLFIAEACVYSIIGVTLGYVLGQTLGKILVAFDLLQGMSLNYSSLSAIVSAIVVMVVVLLSTIYPARVAARTAVPDAVRRWSPPASEGDCWQFPFPFMASAAEVRGLCGFLANYFSAYSEESIGSFFSEKVRIVEEDSELGPEYAVQLLMWLAPFDMGVSQFLHLEFAPSESTVGAYSVEVFIQRVSGQDTYWRRVNQRFTNELRKNFLIWHTLSDEDKQYHQERADEWLTTGRMDREEAAGAERG